MPRGKKNATTEEASSTTEAAPAPAKKEVVKQNGIKRPDSGSITGRLWDIADRISAELRAPAPRKAVVDAYMAEVENANQATAHTQYARWVTFHGASDALRAARAQETEARRAAKGSERTEAQKARDEARAAKAAEKEAEKQRKATERAAKAAAREEERARAKAEKEAEERRKAEAKAAEQSAAA